MALTGEPRQHRVGRGGAAGLAGGDTELDERDEPPVGASPLGVGMPAEAAVGALPGEQPAHEWPFEHMRSFGGVGLVEEVALRLEDDPGLIRVEQPVERGGGDRHVSSPARRSRSNPSRRTPSASSQYSRRTPTRLKPAFS